MIKELVGFSVNRKVTIAMMALAVLAFGSVSLSRLTVNLLPDIAYPSLTVQTEFPNAAPGEVENLITVPVEEAVGVLKGLKELHSVSRSGRSEVSLEFDWGTDIDMLSIDVREKLDRLILPEEAERPIVLRYDPALDPIMRLAFSGAKKLSLMRYIAENQIKDALERIEGVASARVKGGEEEEIQINLNQGKLAAMGIQPEEIALILSSSNINRPGGSLKGPESQYMVRTLNEYQSVEEIANLIVTPHGKAPVALKEMADVVRGVVDREEITRVNGMECVVVEIFKEGDANTVQVAQSVREALNHIQLNLADTDQLSVLSDQSRFIEQAIDEVESALFIGGVLAILVLLCYLRDIRSTLIIAVSIPLSVVATFMLMYQMDVSLNIMSLGGLTLGIGMLVDSSIVVLEAIHRLREKGYSRKRAAIEGTHEVGGAVVASVLTTVAVFLPIVFVQGIAGQLFRDQSMTVTFSLLSSLVVSMTLLPMLASSGKKSRLVISDRRSLFKKAYEKLLRGCLRLKWLILLLAVLLFAVTLSFIPQLGRELIPPLAEGEFYFEVTMPEGTPLPATDRVIHEMEKQAGGLPAVGQVYTSTGTRNVSGGLSLKTRDENLGQVFVTLKDRSNEELERQVANRLRNAYARIPGLEVKLGRTSFFSLKTPIELHFFGENLDQLKDYTLDLKEKLNQVEGLSDVRASLESGNPELNVIFNRDKLARLGFTIRDVSQTLHDRVNGRVVSRFKEDDRHIDIRLRNREEDRNSVLSIDNAVVAMKEAQPITLKSLASIERGRGPAEIHRIKQSRVAILSAEPSGDLAVGELFDSLHRVVAENPPPFGVTYEPGGQNSEMEASFDSMKFALILAVFLVYLVMAATFENLLHPFLILLTIPLASIGVILGLTLFNLSISVISAIGTVFLVGVVVNNAIVLIDAINRLRREGLDKLSAVVEAGIIRLRPIMMTTLTTILGLLPMAFGFGEGSELRQPLAIVVTMGLAVSTLLTLIVIPAFYMVVPSRVSSFTEEELTEQERRVIESS
ncbi:MAG: acriflavin resistance protein [Acidobacteria bacterium]|nr:MAG: acriflavin resistance protein [Acidobacteriota bacterium]